MCRTPPSVVLQSLLSVVGSVVELRYELCRCCKHEDMEAKEASLIDSIQPSSKIRHMSFMTVHVQVTAASYFSLTLPDRSIQREAILRNQQSALKPHRENLQAWPVSHAGTDYR